MLYDDADAMTAHHLLNNENVVWQTSVTNSHKAKRNCLAFVELPKLKRQHSIYFMYCFILYFIFKITDATCFGKFTKHRYFFLQYCELEVLYPYVCAHVIQRPWRVWLWEQRVPADVLKQWRKTQIFSLQILSRLVTQKEWVWESAVMLEENCRRDTLTHTGLNPVRSTWLQLDVHIDCKKRWTTRLRFLPL